MVAFCSTTKIVIPVAFSRWIVSNCCSTSTGARPIDGSSIQRKRGRDISARAMASICCSPPDMVPPRCERRSRNRGNISRTPSRSLSISARSLRMKAPIIRFSSTVNRGKIRRASGTIAIPCATRREVFQLVMSWPSYQTEPLAGRTEPMTAFMVVDLPDALPPNRQTISPRRISMLTSRRAGTWPYRTSTSCKRRTTSAAGAAGLGGRCPSAEVGFDVFWIAVDLLGQAFGDLHAMVHHNDAIRDFHHQRHVVLDEKDRQPAVADRAGQSGDLDRVIGVHAGCGFVEQQQLGARCQRASHLGAAAVRVGEAERRIIEPRLEPLAEEIDGGMDLRLGGALGPKCARPERHGSQHAAPRPVVRPQQDVLPDGQLRKDPDVLKGTGHPLVGNAMRGQPDELPAEQADGSRRWSQDAGNQVEDRGLASAVRPHEADDLTLVDVDVEAVDGRQAAKSARQAADLQDGLASAHVFHSGSSTMAPDAASKSATSVSVTAGSSDASTADSAVSSSSVPPMILRGRMETVPSRPSGRKTITAINTMLTTRYL